MYVETGYRFLENLIESQWGDEDEMFIIKNQKRTGGGEGGMNWIFPKKKRILRERLFCFGE